MQHMLLIYGDPQATPESAPPENAFGDWVEATRALADAGVLIEGDGLAEAGEAVSVTSRSGEAVVTDGPFAETKEVLLGYYLIDVADRHTALGWAARMPMVHWGTVEVRAIADSPASARAARNGASSVA
jgi:hypothetical protein